MEETRDSEEEEESGSEEEGKDSLKFRKSVEIEKTY